MAWLVVLAGLAAGDHQQLPPAGDVRVTETRHIRVKYHNAWGWPQYQWERAYLDRQGNVVFSGERKGSTITAWQGGRAPSTCQLIDRGDEKWLIWCR